MSEKMEELERRIPALEAGEEGRYDLFALPSEDARKRAVPRSEVEARYIVVEEVGGNK